MGTFGFGCKAAMASMRAPTTSRTASVDSSRPQRPRRIAMRSSVLKLSYSAYDRCSAAACNAQE